MAFRPRFGHTHGNGACRDCGIGIHSDDCAYNIDDGKSRYGRFVCLHCAARRGLVTSTARCY